MCRAITINSRQGALQSLGTGAINVVVESAAMFAVGQDLRAQLEALVDSWQACFEACIFTSYLNLDLPRLRTLPAGHFHISKNYRARAEAPIEGYYD